jgi:hypothetical protein
LDAEERVAGRTFSAAYDPPERVWLAVQFSPSEAGQAAGKEFLKRRHLRQEGRDPEVSDNVSPAQIEAMDNWGVQREGSYDYLKTLTFAELPKWLEAQFRLIGRRGESRDLAVHLLSALEGASLLSHTFHSTHYVVRDLPVRERGGKERSR